jgi:nucleoside recognition membrane protein YjiH
MGLVAVIIFVVFTTVFAASANPREVRVLPKWAWVLLCLITAPLGGIFYLAIGRPIGRTNPKGKPLAPDDDPDFLNELRKRLEDE